MIKINLLPKELQEKEKSLDWIILGYAVIGLVALLAAGSYTLQIYGYKKNLIKKARWTQQLNEIKVKVARVEELDAQKTVLNAKRNTVFQLFQGRLLYPKFMSTLYSTLPRDIWLRELSLQEDSQKNIKAVVGSTSLTTNSIAEWFKTLESNPKLFTNISLSEIQVIESADQITTYTFNITFNYHPDLTL